MEIFSVSQINNLAKKTLEMQFSGIAVKGEVSKTTLHSSGHFYLTLKDEYAALDAVIYKGSLRRLSLTPSVGETWICQGRISLWEKTGRFIFVIETAYPSGKGDLYLKFILLKEKLEKEGLFDSSRKKRLPEYPEKVGIVTSPTGAVIRDFVNIYRRRYPVAEVILSPSSVQGENASSELIKAMKKLWKIRVQLIVIARGGGSPEDLAVFNDEDLARAIAASPVPVVSAVGHETDRSISDLAADVAAPTPSAAAELVFPDRKDILDEIGYSEKNLKIKMSEKTRYFKVSLSSYAGSYSLNSVKSKVNEYSALLGYRKDNAVKSMNSVLTRVKNELENSRRKLDVRSLKENLTLKEENLGYRRAEIDRRINNRKANAMETLDLAEKKIFALSPYVGLKKGYAMVYDSEGNLVASGDRVSIDESYDVKFVDKTWQMKAEKEKQ